MMKNIAFLLMFVTLMVCAIVVRVLTVETVDTIIKKIELIDSITE